jgi:uncharacterized protein
MSASEKLIFQKGDNVKMAPAPINPGWVIAGAPAARNFLLSRANEGGAATFLWDCTAGVFNWYYDVDETVYVLEGSVVLCDDDGVEHRLGAGDHVLFRAGSHAVWRVESYVRKVAFLRNPVPRALMLPLAAWNKLKKIAKFTSKEPAALGFSSR